MIFEIFSKKIKKSCTWTTCLWRRLMLLKHRDKDYQPFWPLYIFVTEKYLAISLHTFLEVPLYPRKFQPLEHLFTKNQLIRGLLSKETTFCIFSQSLGQIGSQGMFKISAMSLKLSKIHEKTLQDILIFTGIFSSIIQKQNNDGRFVLRFP